MKYAHQIELVGTTSISFEFHLTTTETLARYRFRSMICIYPLISERGTSINFFGEHPPFSALTLPYPSLPRRIGQRASPVFLVQARPACQQPTRVYRLEHFVFLGACSWPTRSLWRLGGATWRSPLAGSILCSRIQ